MKTARPVPSRPPIAFVTGRRRISRSAAITSWIADGDRGGGLQAGERVDGDERDRADAGVHDRAAVAEHLERARRQLRPALPVGSGVGAHGLAAASIKL